MKKYFKEKLFTIKFSTNKSAGAYVHLPGVELEAAKFKYIHSRVQHCEEYASYQKKLQIKIVRNWISYKKVRDFVYKCVLSLKTSLRFFFK